MALYLTCVCLSLRGFCFSVSHHSKSFQRNIGLPPGAARAMCPYRSHVCPNWKVLHRMTCDWCNATLAPRMVRMCHWSQVSPGLRAGCIIRRMWLSWVLLTALSMPSVMGQDCPPQRAAPLTNIWWSLMRPLSGVGAHSSLECL